MEPLEGKRILITRAIEQAGESAELARARGATPVLFPCLAIECLPAPIRDAAPLLEQPGAQALFTSANGVRCAARVFGDAFAPLLSKLPVVTVGRRTARELERLGVRPAWTPEASLRESSQAGLVEAWRDHGLPTSLVFFRAETGGDAVIRALESAGVAVHLIPAYRAVCPDDDAGPVRDMLARGQVDAVLLGSARAAKHYLRRVGDAALASRPAVAVISDQVARACRDLGLGVQVVAKEASFASMLDGLAAWFGDQARSSGTPNNAHQGGADA